MNEVNITESQVGDVVQGDKYENVPLTSLEKAIDCIVSKHSDDTILVDVFEELAEY
ncbi:MAG: hypothetical protein JKY22_00615 [Flavobacteriaceae bacterium]|nr:hypothetical protein [Flavobacteriaceae bacterium]